MTPLRRQYILDHLAAGGLKGNWIKLTNQEFTEFGGHHFFQGLDIEYIQEQHTVEGGKKGRAQYEGGVYNFNWKLTDHGNQGWRSMHAHHEGKTEMQEHHIDRERLIAQVNANKGAYELVYAKFQALYADELQAQSDRHLAGEIPVNQIAVKDKDGVVMGMLADMSLTFDSQVKELELDSRDVVILSHEEYGQYVDGNATNLLQVAAAVKKLEELP